MPDRIYFSYPWPDTRKIALRRAAVLISASSWQYDGAAFKAMQGLAAWLKVAV